MASKVLIIVSILAVLVAYFARIKFGHKNNSYKSISSQSLHYYSRPHTNIDNNFGLEPVVTSNVWNGTYMVQNPTIWRDDLTIDDQASLVKAVAYFESLNKPFDSLTVADFPLSSELLNKIENWKYQLGSHGRGLQVIRGIPLDSWTPQQIEIFYWAFGRYLGTPGAQDSSGELMTAVKDVGANGTTSRQYKSNAEIKFHCDVADVVGLLCVHTAKSGGASRIVSSVSVYNRLLSLPRGQQIVRRLMRPVFMDTRGTGGVKLIQVTPIRRDSTGVIRTFYHQDYFRSAYRYPALNNSHPMDAETLEALEAYDRVLNEEKDLWLDMKLERGDIQLISNHFVLHSRTEYVDWTQHEIDANERKRLSDSSKPVKGKRQLLRLWVSLNAPMENWSLYFDKQMDLIRNVKQYLMVKFVGL